jgi:hypothetical protein
VRTRGIAAWFFVLIAGLAVVADQAPQSPKRYGVDLNVRKYPQATPKEALGAVLKALGEKEYDYLLAHLADPAFVDKRVEQLAGGFGAEIPANQKQTAAFALLAKETAENFLLDPSKLKDLQKFLADGEWEEGTELATARLRTIPSRKVFMKMVAPNRWVLLDKEK